ncbi:TPA: hypothetical protein HA251_06115 [Candidatus Woesearchaeota archaeon]|nr:hypothetical protein [Candidatus Woesearchaeota archaeon]
MSDIVWAVVGFFAGLYFFFRAFGARKKLQLIESIPTSKIRSIAMGQAEIVGEVLIGKKSLIAPFSGTKCAYYRCTIEEYRRQGKHSRWVEIKSAVSENPFYLEDDTGKVLVDPKGAEIDVPQTFEFNSSWGKDPDKRIVAYLNDNGMDFEGFLGANKTMRYREHLLIDKQQVYVMGYAGKNPHVKSSAINADTIMIQNGDGDNVYMISTKSEKELLAWLRYMVFGGWIGGGALAIICLFLIFAFFGIL